MALLIMIVFQFFDFFQSTIIHSSAFHYLLAGFVT